VAEGDIALVAVDPDPGDDEPQCAVLLDVKATEGPYHAAGFPKDDMVEVGLQVIRYTGYPRHSPETGNLVAVTLTDSQVTFGMSGGPVLDHRTGAVVAVVRYSKDPNSVLGGGAIPISFIAQAFDEVRERLEAPPAATGLWRDAVPPEAWLELGRAWPSQTPTFDIRVSGALSRWLVALEPDGEPLQEVTVRDLGEEVAEVLFQWAQTRRLRGEDEVQLLGRLLSGALLPKGLAQRLTAAQRQEELHVRLRVDPKSGLADVPWELATLPGSRESLSAARSVRFVRVVKELEVGEASFVPRQEAVPVLGVVVQPPGYVYPDVFYDGNLVSWPKDVGAVTDGLKVSLSKAAFAPSIYQNPTPATLDEDLGAAVGGPFDVFHYIGLGKLEKGEPRFAMFDGVDRATWITGATLSDWIAQSGARVVVIELMMPPPALDLEPVSPSQIVEKMARGVHAVVSTRVPVHVRQFGPFNDRFYACISAGDTVESAAQSARRELYNNNPLGDFAGFGWFTLNTSERVGLQLYGGEAAVRSSKALEQAVEPPPPPQVTAPDRPSPDAFQRH
jgi:hypothetical protein